MSANELLWIFNDSGSNFGLNLQNDTLSFRKTYDNSRLIDDIGNCYNVNSNDYQSIIYTDLESIFFGNSFTLSLTLSEKFDDITKPGNLFTLGYHTKGSKNTCITVGRKANTREVVLGTISEFTSIKGIARGSHQIYSDVSYVYVLVHNNLEIERNRFHLYIKETGPHSSGYSLICDSSALTNISILQPKLFIGSSLWTNELEWNNQFDLCDVTLTSNIRLTVNETIYPVDVVVSGSITELNLTNHGSSNISSGHMFSVSFKSKFRFSSLNIYVTSTTDYGTIQLQYDSYMYDNILLEYKYVFNGTITDTYNSGTISYMFDLNGTIYNNKSAIATQLNVRTTSSPSPVSLSLDPLDNQFDYSAAPPLPMTVTIVYMNGVLKVRGEGETGDGVNRHILSKTLYTLPLYVECTLKPIRGDTTILVTTEDLDGRTNFKVGSANSIVWGTGSHGTEKYAWAVSGTKSEGNDTDDDLGSMTKFSMFITDDEVIMYQGDGAQKYLRTRANYPSFWSSVDGRNVRVGTWDWEYGDYSDFKIGSNNPWV
jgi:hypothetical protein